MEHQQRISLQPARISTYYGFFCNFWSPNPCRPLCYFPNMKWCEITHHILFCNCVHVHVTNRPVHIYGKIKLEILSPISLPARCSAGFTFTSVHSNNLSIIQKSIFTHFLSPLCCFDIIIVTVLPIF